MYPNARFGGFMEVASAALKEPLPLQPRWVGLQEQVVRLKEQDRKIIHEVTAMYIEDANKRRSIRTTVRPELFEYFSQSEKAWEHLRKEHPITASSASSLLMIAHGPAHGKYGKDHKSLKIPQFRKGVFLIHWCTCACVHAS